MEECVKLGVVNVRSGGAGAGRQWPLSNAPDAPAQPASLSIVRRDDLSSFYINLNYLLNLIILKFTVYY